ncbi:MAG: GldG family protein [Chromatiales bacterium]|nr:GldG family protein [Chromatiales bacterium]
MKIDANSRRLTRLQNLVFVVLLLAAVGLLAWLSTQYRYEADWTSGNRNTLSAETRQLLSRIEGELVITAYVADDVELHRRIGERIDRYRRHKADVVLEFVNPDLEPQRAKADDIQRAGQLVLRLGGRKEVVGDLAEQTLANALQRLVRGEERYAIFLEGHGERALAGTDSKGLAQLAQVLERSGLALRELNLVRTPAIPDNIALLVIAAPQQPLLAGEVELIRQYVDNGGALLWLVEPGELQGLAPLAGQLGVGLPDGLLVDANQQLRSLLGMDHPAIIPVAAYGRHPATADLEVFTLFPVARPVEAQGSETFEQQALLTTLSETWLETGPLEGDVTFDEAAGDRPGPLTLGLALTRQVEDSEQRIAVIGDADFLANGFLGHGGNLDLATRLVNWLAADDSLIAITSRGAPDTSLDLSPSYGYAVAIGFLFVLPLALLTAGLVIWLRRRRA